MAAIENASSRGPGRSHHRVVPNHETTEWPSQGLRRVDALWQIIPYVIITTAEVMVSITGLEFAYTQAPKRMKSTLMGFWLLTVALGNVLVALLATFGNLELGPRLDVRRADGRRWRPVRVAGRLLSPARLHAVS